MEKKEKIKALMEKTAELSSKEEGLSAQETGELLDAYEELVQLLCSERDERKEEVSRAKLNHALVCASIHNIATSVTFGTNSPLARLTTLGLIADIAMAELKGEDKKCDIIAIKSRGHAIE